jgi:hypothetical protein
MKKNTESLVERESNGGKKMLSFLLVLVLLVAVAFAGWSYYNLKQTKANLEKAQTALNNITDPQKQQELLREETTKVLERVKRHILVPTDEEPILSVITDIAKLVAEQPFYKDAHNGDKILMFKKAGWGLVYDPNRDIIVKVAQIDNTSSDTKTDSTKKPVTGEPSY